MAEKRKKVSVALGDAEAYVRARREERELFQKLEGKPLDNHDIAGNERLAREQVQQAEQQQEQDRQADQQQAEQRRQQEQREQLEAMVQRSATAQPEQEEEMER